MLKAWFGIRVYSFFWEIASSWEAWGPQYQTKGFTMDRMIFKHGTPFHDLTIHRLNMAELLVTHILTATTLCLSAFPRNTYCSIAKNAKSAMLNLFSFQNLKFLGDSPGNDWKKCEK